MVQKIITGIVFLFTVVLLVVFALTQKNTKEVLEQKEYIVVKSFHFGYPFEIPFSKGVPFAKVVQKFNINNEMIQNYFIKENSSWTEITKETRLYEDTTFKVS